MATPRAQCARFPTCHRGLKRHRLCIRNGRLLALTRPPWFRGQAGPEPAGARDRIRHFVDARAGAWFATIWIARSRENGGT
jgi:hypothetical protein